MPFCAEARRRASRSSRRSPRGLASSSNRCAGPTPLPPGQYIGPRSAVPAVPPPRPPRPRPNPPPGPCPRPRRGRRRVRRLPPAAPPQRGSVAAAALLTASRVARLAGRVLPDLRAGDGVDRVDAVRRAEIHHAVDHHRRARESSRSRLERPRPLQAGHVRDVDLVQRGEPRAALIAEVMRPVAAGRTVGSAQSARRQPARRRQGWSEAAFYSS